jgi:hypothetical protein
MKVDKKPIIENLKHWYSIDSLLLNEHASKAFVKGSDYKEYLVLKSSLLSNLYEFHNHIGYKPKDVEYGSDKVLQESAVKLAKTSKALTSKMMQRPEFMKQIKESLKHEVTDKAAFSSKLISERFTRMNLDNILIGLPLMESVSPNKAKDFEGAILEEAYRMMRTSLIHHVKNSELVKKNLTENRLRSVVSGMSTIGSILGGGFAHQFYRAARAMLDQCTKKCGVFAINTGPRQACMLKCKISIEQRALEAMSKAMSKATTPEQKKSVTSAIVKKKNRIAKLSNKLNKLTSDLNVHGKVARNPSDQTKLL